MWQRRGFGQHQEHRGVPYRPPCVDYVRELLFTRYPALRRFDEALKVSQAEPGQWVAVSGAAGGGHLAAQYAVAMGLRMIGIDAGKEKEGLVRRLGADGFCRF
jgi:NADPH-dependent curcumin reductase CurA